MSHNSKIRYIVMSGLTALLMQTAFGIEIQSTDFKNQPLSSSKNLLSPYMGLSIGSGESQNTANNTGKTSLLRISLGSLYSFTPDFSLGAEIGAQTENEVLLNADATRAFHADMPPLFLTVKPSIDLLAEAKYHFDLPIFLEAKAGAVYLRTMTDNADIQSDSTWRPEIQVGAGYDITNISRIILSYQRFFGQTPTFSHINYTSGTADLNHVPTWQAALLTLEVNV